MDSGDHSGGSSGPLFAGAGGSGGSHFVLPSSPPTQTPCSRRRRSMPSLALLVRISASASSSSALEESSEGCRAGVRRTVRFGHRVLLGSIKFCGVKPRHCAPSERPGGARAPRLVVQPSMLATFDPTEFGASLETPSGVVVSLEERLDTSSAAGELVSCATFFRVMGIFRYVPCSVRPAHRRASLPMHGLQGAAGQRQRGVRSENAGPRVWCAPHCEATSKGTAGARADRTKGAQRRLRRARM